MQGLIILAYRMVPEIIYISRHIAFRGRTAVSHQWHEGGGSGWTKPTVAFAIIDSGEFLPRIATGKGCTFFTM